MPRLMLLLLLQLLLVAVVDAVALVRVDALQDVKSTVAADVAAAAAAAAAGAASGSIVVGEQHQRQLPDVGVFLTSADLVAFVSGPEWDEEQKTKYWPVGVLLLIMFVSGGFMAGLAYLLLDHGRQRGPEASDSEAAGKGSAAARLLADAEVAGAAATTCTADEEAAEARKCASEEDPHRVPWQQYAAMLFWFMLLICQAAFTRLVCQFGVPHDCHPHMDRVKVVYDLQYLLGFGFVLATLVSLVQPQRWAYVFQWDRPWRGLVFLVVFFGTSPVFGSLDLVPFLTHFSLTASGTSSIVNNAVLWILVIGVVGLLGWHLYYAYMTNPLQGFVAYIASRVLLWSFYVAYGMAASSDNARTFHLHHYITGFLCASLAEFNHPVSLLLLAIGSGIMVQGISAYDADPIIYERPQILQWE